MHERTVLAGQRTDYTAAKASVIGMTHDLAGYLSPMGSYFNAISPGGFKRKIPDACVEGYSDGAPMDRMGRDGIDLKGAILFLGLGCQRLHHRCQFHGRRRSLKLALIGSQSENAFSIRGRDFYRA